MKIAYSWGRFSTLAQGESGRDSQRRQIATAKAWCQRNGYTLAEQTFFDKGKSGFKGEHIAEGGDLLKFIKLVEDGTISKGVVLCIDSYDRFSRLPPSKALSLFLRVIDAGIKLVFSGSYEQRIIDAASIDKEPNILQFIIGEVIRSYNESNEKSRKVSEALRAKKERIAAGEVAPYNNIPKYFTYVPITKERGQYIHNDNTKVVRELVDWILAGKSLYYMADELNKRKVKTFRRGVEWSGSSIRQILKNRTLIGEYLGNKGFVPPIIDLDTFKRAQNILHRNTYNRGKRANLPNMFRGICFCAHCGKSMSVASQVYKGVLYRYLKCSVGGLGRNHSCINKKLIRLDEMETEFFAHFFKKDPYQLINGDDAAELRQLRATIEDKQIQLNKLNSSVKDAISLLGVIKADELKDKLAKLEAERTKVKSDIDALNQKLFNLQDAPKVNDEVRKILRRIAYLDSQGELQVHSSTSFKDVKDLLKDKEVIEEIQYDISGKGIEEQLKVVLNDTGLREKLRIALPSLIGKVTVDATKGQFYVWNRVGKLIYESTPQQSNRNNSARWKQSLKQWTTRTVKGRKITVKRKVKRLLA